MSEVQTGLIQMNAHMVRPDGFEVLLAIGIVAAILFITLSIGAIVDKCKWYAILFAAFAIAGIMIAVIAINKPMVKEIKACANGPVSIEQIAAVYDVVDVDGKMLTLRER